MSAAGPSQGAGAPPMGAAQRPHWPMRPQAWGSILRSAELERVIDNERRVVRESPVLVDRNRARRCCYAGSCDLIVDAPADVFLPRLPAIGPPRVLLRACLDAAKDVDE